MSNKNFARMLGMKVEEPKPTVKRDRGLDFVPATNHPGYARILKGEPKTKVNHSPYAWNLRNRGLFA